MSSRPIQPVSDELLTLVADLRRSPLTRALFATRSQFVAVVDLDGIVVAVNDYARRPHLDPQDFVGHPLWAMPPLRNDPTAEGTWRTRFAEAMRDAPVRSEEAYPVRTGGSVAVRTEVTALRAADDAPVLGFVVRGANVENVRETERRLREQEALGRLTFDDSPSLMAVLGPDGEIRDVNAAFLKLGASRSDFVGLNIVDVARKWPGGDAYAVEWERRITAAQGATRPLRYSHVEESTDGEIPRGFDSTLTPIRDDDTGELKALLYELHERTGSIEAEVRVRKSEERLRVLAEAVPQMLWIGTDDGVEYFSPRWEEFTGRPIEELLGRGYVDLIHPDDRAAAAVVPSAADGSGAPNVFRLRRHDGEYRWVEAHARAELDPATGEPVRWFGGTLDVTDQRQASATASAREEQLAAALGLTGLGRYEVNFREQTVDADERVAEIMGVPDLDRVMRTGGLDALLDTVEPAHRDRVRAKLEAALVPGGPDYDAEYPIIRDTPDGPERRWIAILGRAEFDESGPVRMVGVVDDVTERRQEDEARIRFQKLEAMGTLAGGIAHDFNNVIGAILSYARVAEAELAAGESPAESLSEIARGALRAGELTKRLLTFAREEPLQKVPLELGDVVKEAAALVRPTLPRGTELQVTVGAGLPEVLGDTTQLHQVVVNLITNAGQALAAGRTGHIDVSVEQIVLGERRTGIVAPLAPGDYLRLRVADDGPGIPEAIVSRIFDPFFTTKGPNEGTGLGLAAVHTIIRNHGGVVAADPRPGGGAMFTAFLPVNATPDAPASLPDRGPAVEGEQPVARVLFVDDEEALVRLAYRAMPYCGCEVTGFTDSQEAVDAFTATPDAFDAIVTDFSMPRLTGLDLTERVRAIRPDVPVVLTSGYMGQDDHADAQRRGVSAILPKPCSIDDLASEVLRLLAREGN